MLLVKFTFVPRAGTDAGLQFAAVFHSPTVVLTQVLFCARVPDTTSKEAKVARAK